MYKLSYVVVRKLFFMCSKLNVFITKCNCAELTEIKFIFRCNMFISSISHVNKRVLHNLGLQSITMHLCNLIKI